MSVDERSEYQGDGLGLVDDKGRVAIPASLRQALATNSPRPDGKDGGTIIVGVHPKQTCLRAYDPAFVKKILERAESAKQGNTIKIDPKDIWGSLGLK